MTLEASAAPLADLSPAWIDALLDAVWLVDAASLRILAANRAADELFGSGRHRLVGTDVRQFAATPEDQVFWSEVADGLWPHIESDTLVQANGRLVPVTRRASVVEGGDASARGSRTGRYLVVLRDRTAQLQVEDELADRAAELAATLESTADGILVIETSGRIGNFNQKFASLWSLPDALVSRDDDDRVLDWMRGHVADSQGYMRRLAEIEESTTLQAVDTLQLKNGRVLERTTLPQRSRNRPIGRVYSFRDITEQLEALRRIETLSHTDALTGLANARMLADRVGFALALAQRARTPLALLFANLDHFNRINETMGHGFGDRVLAEVAARLRQCLRQVDTVARLSGDEFVLLIHEADPAGAATTAHRVQRAMLAPFSLDGISFTVTCSLGIALYPEDGRDLDELLRSADAAMHQAKAGGRGSFRFHRPQRSLDAFEKPSRLKLDHAMRQALEAGRFRLHYQPQLDMASGQVVGAEALLRWRDPELGNVPPGDFIPVAEESGFIIAIGDWVMREAIDQAAQWHAAGRHLVLSVNVSALQFQQPHFVDSVATALQRHGLPADRLELELTESILVRQTQETLQRLQELAALGLRLAIDDFGTGYSSLAYLKRFPIHRLKIDRSFVGGLPGDASDAGIVNAIVHLGKALGLAVVAEGVETEAQRVFLQQAGCEFYQGYLFAPALEPAALEARLDAHALSVRPVPMRLIKG